jgi:hypothetical protein
MELTFLDAEGGPRRFAGDVGDGTVIVSGETLAALTGWVRKAEGLCREDVCVPVRDPRLDVAGGVDLARVAASLGRPVVVDTDAGLVALAERAAVRRGPIEAGVAPDFTLPQLDGASFTFSTLGRRRKLLLAWSSW